MRTRAANSVLTHALLLMTTLAPAATWEPIAPLPEPNGGFVCGAVGGKIVVAGGTNWKDDTKQWLDRFWVFDPAAGTWRDAGRFASPLAYPASAGDGKRIWYVGGSSGVHSLRALVRIDASLDPALVNRAGHPSVYAGAALLGDLIYIVGGTDDQAHFERAVNHFHSIDVRNGRMARLADHPERAFAVGAVAACAGQIFVFGGASATDPTNVVNYASAHAYSPKSGRWGAVRPLPSPRRGITAVTLDDHRILLAGGYKNDAEGFTGETFIYDTRADGYLTATPLPVPAMVGLVKLGGHVYCLGGEDRKKHRTDKAFRISVQELFASVNKGTARPK